MKPNLIVRTVDHLEIRVDPREPYYARVVAWNPSKEHGSCQVFLMTQDTLQQIAEMCNASAVDMRKFHKEVRKKNLKAQAKEEKLRQKRLKTEAKPVYDRKRP